MKEGKRDGKAIPVWFNLDDQRRLETAAALAGYQHISTYIRDRALGGADLDNVKALNDLQEAQDELERNQKRQEGILSALLFLTVKRAGNVDLGQLREALRTMRVDALMAGDLPELEKFLGN